MASFEDHVQKLDIRSILITSILTAMSIIVAWLWKDALVDTITRLLPTQQGFLSSYVIAIIGTFFVVVLAYIMLKGQEIRLKHIYSFRERMKIKAYKSERLRRIKGLAKIRKASFRYTYKPKRSHFF